MTDASAGRKWIWWVVSAIAAVAILGFGWAVTSGREGTTGDFPGGLFSRSGGGAEDPASRTETTVPASESSTGVGGSTQGGSASGGKGAGTGNADPGAGGGQAPTPGGTSDPAEPGASGTFYIRVSWWNDTEVRAPSGFLIKWGSGRSWSPDTTRRSQIGTIGPFVVGAPQSFRVSPDGSDSAELLVPITITPEMTSGSQQDGVHVEVRDYTVRVLGNPVDNTEIIFTRP